ncbi:MAG: NAD(P)-dependent oxidoreductase [Planctomycetia bacterium]|nr:NAD(P)-dependent oxidoreductase [Planctomycetia bacterium]
MKALITGITGFVGGHLTQHLLASGDEVLGTSQNGDWPEDFRLPVPLVAYDLAADMEPAFIDAIDTFAPDVIYHLAGISIPAECEAAGEPTPKAWNINVEGVRRILGLSAALRRRPRVIFTSSSHVYRTVQPDEPIVDENAPCEPRTAYGRTKLAAERLCDDAVRQAGLDIVTVRSFSQAGERQDQRLMLAEWATALARRDPEMTVGGLNVTIDLTDVRDSVRALRLLALHGASGTVYNVGSGVPRTTGELLGLLRQAAGDSRPVRARSTERRSDPVADLSRLQAATGWHPEIPIERTIADVWNYWRRRIRNESA